MGHHWRCNSRWMGLMIQNMSWDAVNGVFKVTLDLTAGDIKFRANDGWGYNLGGSSYCPYPRR